MNVFFSNNTLVYSVFCSRKIILIILVSLGCKDFFTKYTCKHTDYELENTLCPGSAIFTLGAPVVYSHMFP